MIDAPLRPVGDAQALAAQVRRVAGALLDDALGRVRGPERAGTGKAVHESRKRIKELRALLRLTGDALVGADGQPARRRENEALRLAANGLGDARDAAVRVQTLDGLMERFADELSVNAFASLREALVRRQETAQAGGSDGFARAREILEAARARVDAWHVVLKDSPAPSRGSGAAWQVVGPALRRIYWRGRRAMKGAIGTDEAEMWHEWRKRAKDLRYALELMRESAPALLGDAAASAKALTDDLGEDHDLAVLLASATSLFGGQGDGAAARSVAGLDRLVARRREELQLNARRGGALLYAESSGAFARRIGAYWRAALAR